MPEGPEVELDALHERMHEEAEREGTRLLKIVALSTAILAAFAAIASLQAGATVNEALVLKTEATQFQSRASDQWAYYQAKGVKEAVTRAAAASYVAAGKTPPPSLDSTAARYAAQQTQISAAAQQLEHERDERSVEADHLLHRHHGFADAVALFQVAIALGAVTALTRSRHVFIGSVVLGVAGIAMFAWQLLS